MGQDVVGQNFVGQDVTGAISLGRNVVGQEVSGAGRRGAGRHWGKISGAGGHGAEGSGAGSGSPPTLFGGPLCERTERGRDMKISGLVNLDTADALNM